jgi:hypothetical protein
MLTAARELLGWIIGWRLTWTVILAFQCADFATGLFHWAEDRYLEPGGSHMTCKWIPQWLSLYIDYVARKNQLHHDKPLDMVQCHWARNMLTTLPLTGLVFTALLVAGFSHPFGFLLILFSTFGNLVHRWTHESPSQLPWGVVWLQRVGILLRPQLHRLHHYPTLKVQYCALGNVLNYVLDQSGFWRGLEWCVARVLGCTPKS